MSNFHGGASEFKLLGIVFTTNLEEMTAKNYDPFLRKIENTIKYWNKRNLTPIGKIAVIKSLLL